MAYLIVNDREGDHEMRSQMRRSMRMGYRNYGGSSVMMRDHGYEQGYRSGYKHGWEDHEDESMEEDYRRMRDSRGRYV